MWHVTNIIAKNFISFKNLDLDIPQDGCALIYGLNEDNAMQKNNGTGKSSIIEAICYAITGESMRGVKDAELINDYADSAVLELTLENDYDQTLFVINRVLSRDSAQVITCHKYDAEDNEIAIERTVQPTVLDYNRYILEEIGLSREDIYSNFILSNTRYESFFNASDKSKKAMINHFSGADAVDLSIEALKADMKPAEEALQSAKEARIAVEAKIEAVNAQIAESESKSEEYASSKQMRLQKIDEDIAEKRESMRKVKELQAAAENRLETLRNLRVELNDLSGRDISLQEGYETISGMLTQHGLDAIDNYLEKSRDIADYVTECEQKTASIRSQLKTAEESLDTLKEHYHQAKHEMEEYKLYCDEQNKLDELDIKDIDDELKDVETIIVRTNKEIGDKEAACNSLNQSIQDFRRMLMGTITCPKCGHQFFDKLDISVEEARHRMDDCEAKYEHCAVECEQLTKSLADAKGKKAQLADEISEIEHCRGKRDSQLRLVTSKVSEAVRDVESGESGILSLNNRIQRLTDNIDTAKSKLSNMCQSMFSTALDIVDTACDMGKRYVESQREHQVAIEASITTLCDLRKSVEAKTVDDLVISLRKSLESYAKELKDVDEQLGDKQREYDRFVLQETHFNQFKSHLANKKIDAIAGVTNAFLDRIGSDLRVELLGFKVLKTGKLRDKITVNLLRNGIPCGSYAKFSGGERARVNLASILALQRLTNNACPEGKGLDIVILDEVLEASDSTGIESCCDALNKLKATSLLVTQNPIVDHDGKTIVVVKANGYSHIERS